MRTATTIEVSGAPRSGTVDVVEAELGLDVCRGADAAVAVARVIELVREVS